MSIRMLIAMMLLSGCAAPTKPVSEVHACKPGNECAVDGVLAVDAPWEVTLRVSDGCIALAMPESYQRPEPSLVNRSVRVSGFAMTQPEMLGAEYFYEVEGRRVNKNNCDFAIIVSEIADARGNVVWTKR